MYRTMIPEKKEISEGGPRIVLSYGLEAVSRLQIKQGESKQRAVVLLSRGDRDWSREGPLG